MGSLKFLNIVFFALISIYLSLHSTTSFSQHYKWTHYGLRPLAMGNAFVAISNDYNALFYNPAGLAKLEKWDGELLNIYVGTSKNTKDLWDEFRALKDIESDDTSAIIDIIEGQNGKSNSVTFGLTPHLIFPNFGFGIGADLSGTIIFHRYPSVEVSLGLETITPISFAYSFLDKKLSLGASVKHIYKHGVFHEFSVQDISAFSSNKDSSGQDRDLDDFIVKGSAVGFDFGMLFTPTQMFEPTLGISITDFGTTPFNQSDKATSVSIMEARPASVNVGLSAKPIRTSWIYLLTAADLHSINQPFSMSKKVNLGAELGIGSFLKFQAGLHHGYASGGFELDLGPLSLRAVTYAEELGPTAGTIEDRRYLVQIKLLI